MTSVDPPRSKDEELPSQGELIALSFGVNKSLRYHAKRRAFFDALQRAALALAAIAGSAAFVAIVGEETELAKWFSLAIAIVAGFDAVLGFAERARKHDDLYRRFADLAAAMEETAAPTTEQIRKWRAQRLLIEKDEPSQLGALNVRCHNEEAEARGYGADVKCRVRWHQILFSQFLTLPPFSFPPLAKKPAQGDEPTGSV